MKPSNLFLRSFAIDGLTLLDFGVARQVLGTPSVTQSGAIVGTPAYLAPEQVRGQRVLETSVDIFALGCVLYECLIGHPPFAAEQIAAVLAKILFEETPSLRVLRPSIPLALESLCHRMLAKDPARRPRDASALLSELDALEPLLTAGETAVAPAAKIITLSEQQLCSVVIAVPPAQELAATMADGEIERERESKRWLTLRKKLSRFCAQTASLADGSLIATLMSNTDAASDQALQAARCALVLRAHWPEARVALATGLGMLNERLPVGEVIARAAQLLRAQVTPQSVLQATDRSSASASASALASEATEAEDGVAIDALSSKLLEPYFFIKRSEGEATLATLQGERPPLDEARTLLGKPTPFVGREYELRMLDAALAGMEDSPVARAFCIVAPPGMGKSRLCHEFVRRLRSQGAQVEVLFGRSDPRDVGLSYGLLSQAMRSLCELHSSDSASTRRQKLQSRISRYLPAAEIPRVAEFLSELCNIPLSDPISPPLRAARGEPALMNDQLSWAFVDWLRAECEQHPVLLVLEDLHFGDEPTIKLVDNALRQLKTQPLMVLALARPEVRTRFPGLWSGRVQEVILAPLSQKACERFIAQVLDASPDPAVVRRIVRQSAGNALYLEELIRAAAEDKDRGGEPPATVLAMLQARLQQLSPDLRCILRAASVFGATFSQAGVLALVGVDGDGAEAETALSSLVQAMRLLPLTMRVRALLGQGRTAESMLAADDGLAQLRELGTAGYGELALRLAVVEAYRAGGRQAAAHQALTEALQQLHLRAARIPDEQVRSCFLTRVPDNIRLLELGQNGR